MKIKSITLKGFKRFEHLSIPDLPPARLVVLAGPNGSGKSSLFDAFSVWQQSRFWGLNWDPKYYEREQIPKGWSDQVQLEFYGESSGKKAFYLRTAYRNDPDFQLNQLSRQGDPVDELRVRRMIDGDGVVGQNYQRLASAALEDAFDRMDETHTLKQFRDAAIGEISTAVSRLFPDLLLESFGNPLDEGTFRFTKGKVSRFSYKNLSGGEKAAFDLLLDMIVKRRKFDNTVFGIDEPESHMNTRLQGALLSELYQCVPEGSQLWISTHSIGMMRKARELYQKNPGEVIFLDFEGNDYDSAVIMRPVTPTRVFWERVLRVALDDLADLVAPNEIVICEGNPKGPVQGKNEEHDARCYELIFRDEFPDTKFISGGSSKEVSGDRLKFAAAFPNVIKGIKIRRLIDRDDHSPEDASDLKKKGVWTLSRRHIESYLYDEEVLAALYQQKGRILEFQSLQTTRDALIAASIARGNAPDDVKSAAAQIASYVKTELGLTASGNDQMAFARNILAHLIRPGARAYADLKKEIFDLP